MLETTNPVYALNPSIGLRTIAELDQYWAFNLADGDHYELNETAYWLLSRFKDENTADSVVMLFTEEFDVKNTDYKKDIIEIVGEFIQQALIIEKRCDNEKD